MRLRILLASAGLATLLAAAPAHAAVYTVVAPLQDPGTCQGFVCNGLQGAADAAKTNAGPDEIDLQATSYTVSKGLTLSDTGGVTIVGKGAQATTITANPGVQPVANSVTGTATLEHLKVSGGNVSTRNGGGISNAGVMTLDHVEVSGNTTSAGNGGGNGGGIASTGSLTIRYSLIANNTASTNGGGIFITAGNPAGALTASTLNISDSTVALNHATTSNTAGGGIVMSGFSGNQATLERVTVGDNTVGGRSGGAGIFIPAGGGTLTAHATIVAGNTMLQGPSANCSGAVTDGGANVENLATCGFTAASDRQNATTGLATALASAGGETDVLTIPATSPAVDLASCSGVTDQRDLPRPQGAACDAGAYEVDQPPDVILDSGPSGVISGGTVTFTFHSDEPGVSFQCKLDGQTPGAFTPCVSPVSYGVPPGGYAFSVRAVDGTGNVSPTPAARTFTVAAPLPGPPVPVPVFHKSVVVKRVSGTVKVKLKGTNKFVDISTVQSVPLGSTIDVRHGKIDLTSVPEAGGKPQTARFYGGEFKITQPGGITQLALNQPLAACQRGHAASAAAAKKKKPKTRSLWGDGHGSFRTKGQYSAATVRGTKWFVEDSCAGTLTKVAHGVVSVRDEVRHKTITLRAGKKYLARPKRR
jgi:hypothetical protein